MNSIFSALSDFPFAPLLWFFGAIAFVAIWFYCLKGLIQDGNKYAEESSRIVAKLIAALDHTRKLAHEKLAGVDEQKLAEVEDLLARAAHHINPPVCDSRMFYDIYMVSWHRQGLELVEKANQLIDGNNQK